MTNTDWISSAVRGAIPAIVILSLIFFRKRFPTRPTKHRIDWDSDELHDRFKSLNWRIQGGMLLIMVVFAWGFWFVLSRANRLIAALDTPQAIHLLPQSAIWWFFPGFGALACSLEITLQLLGLFVGRETAELFSDWTNNTTRGWVKSRYQGIDSRRVLRWMALLIALPIGLFTLLALPMHANVGPESIRDCGYAFKTCKVYPLADVTRITEISGFRDKSGKLINRAGLVVDLKDGRRWSSAEWGDWENHVYPPLKSFLLTKTGLSLSYAMTEDDIPQLPASP